MRDPQDVDVLSGSPSPSPDRSGPSRLLLSIPVTLTVIALDQLTKRWALGALEPGSCSQPDACIDLILGVRFRLFFNTGASFSRGEGLGPLFGILALVASGVLLYLSTRRTDRLGVALFGAIAGGALGNLIDRFYRAEDGFLSGPVVDFIDVGWWPVFNVADSAIVVGVIAVAIMTFLEHEPEPDDAAPAEDGPDVGTAVDPDDAGGDGHAALEEEPVADA